MAFDIVGSKEKAVAIIEKNGAKAEEIVKTHKNVKSVLVKTSSRKGKYRLYKYRLVYGDKNTEVLHREHGCVFKLDPRKVYFSPRESEERQRIARKAKNGERILVMFSGVSPLGIAIAKEKKCEVVCVEANKSAYKYAEKNVLSNKLKGSVKNINADVKNVYEKIGKFDRIIMPLPEKAVEYLEEALHCSKKRSVIHVYGISEYSNLSDIRGKIKSKAGKKIKIIGSKLVLAYAPRIWKGRVDFKVI